MVVCLRGGDRECREARIYVVHAEKCQANAHAEEGIDSQDCPRGVREIGPLLPGGGATLRTLTSLGGGV